MMMTVISVMVLAVMIAEAINVNNKLELGKQSPHQLPSCGHKGPKREVESLGSVFNQHIQYKPDGPQGSSGFFVVATKGCHSVALSPPTWAATCFPTQPDVPLQCVAAVPLLCDNCSIAVRRLLYCCVTAVTHYGHVAAECSLTLLVDYFKPYF